MTNNQQPTTNKSWPASIPSSVLRCRGAGLAHGSPPSAAKERCDGIVQSASACHRPSPPRPGAYPYVRYASSVTTGSPSNRKPPLLAKQQTPTGVSPMVLLPARLPPRLRAPGFPRFVRVRLSAGIRQIYCSSSFRELRAAAARCNLHGFLAWDPDSAQLCWMGGGRGRRPFLFPRS